MYIFYYVYIYMYVLEITALQLHYKTTSLVTWLVNPSGLVRILLGP